MTPRIFAALARDLVRGDLGQPATVILDGIEWPVRVIFGREQVRVDAGDGQTAVVSEPVVSVCLGDLPRKPKAGDRVFVEDVWWKVDEEPLEGGSGMADCKVSRAGRG